MKYEQGVTRIANLALTALGLERITNINQENDSAMLMKEHYELTLRTLLGERDWNFARRTIDLTQLNEPDMYKNYEYSFSLPADFIASRSIVPEQYYEIYDNDTIRLNRALTKIERVIDANDYTVFNEYEVKYVELTYTMMAEDPMKYNPAFIQYFAYTLAADTGFMLTGDMSVVNMVVQMANSFQIKAYVEDGYISRHKEYGEKRPWYRDHSRYYALRYRDRRLHETENIN